MITLQGLGPIIDTLQGTETAMFPPWVWKILSGLSAVGATLLLRFLMNAKLSLFKNKTLKFDVVLVGSILGLHFLFFLFREGDRYLLPVVALLIAYIGTFYRENFRIYQPIALLITALIGIYSFIGTQNYLNWNTVRWREANILVAEGAKPEQIEAGYEWCGWHLYAHTLRGFRTTNDSSKKWYLNYICPINTAEYVISFSALDGYEVIKKSTYSSLYDTSPWLYVLKKKH